MTVRIVVREGVFIKGLPLEMENLFCSENTFPNPKIETLTRLGKWTGNTPKDIRLWRKKDDWISLPRGYESTVLTTLRSSGIDFTIEYAFPPALPFPNITPTGKLFDYQETALRELLRYPTGTLEAPVGSGKTQILLTLIAELKIPSIILVHTSELFYQTIDRCTEWLDYVPGTYGAGKKVLKDISVGMVQTLVREQVDKNHPLYDRFGCVIQDECFIPGTLVESVPIENQSEGSSVLSLNTKDGTFSPKKILRVFKRKITGNLVSISAGNNKIVCTESHKIWTRKGWTVARNIKSSDEVMVYEKTDADCKLFLVSEGIPGKEQDPARLFKTNREGLLQSGLLGGSESTSKLSHNVGNKQKICIGQNESSQPHEAGICTAESLDIKKICWGLEASRSGWERKAGTGTRKNHDGSFGMARIYRTDEKGQRQPSQTSKPLQNRYCLPGDENSNRNRRAITPLHIQKDSGQEEGSVLKWSRVDRIEILEQGSDGEFARLCPEGYVYNLEVETDHTYFANGILVSNCHHTPSSTFTDVITRLPYRYKYGVTATPWRKDRNEKLIFRVIGPITAKVSHAAVEEAGRILWPEIIPIYTNFYYPIESADEWSVLIGELTEDLDRNRLICETVGRHLEGNGLVLTDRINHADTLARMLSGFSPVLLTGNLSRKQRAMAMEKIKAGVKLTVATVHVAGEGLSVNKWNQLYLVSPIVGGSRTVQALGRITRPYPGKDKAVLFDFIDGRIPMLKQAAKKRFALYNSKGGDHK